MEYTQILKTNPKQQLKAPFIKFIRNNQVDFIICTVPSDQKLEIKKVKLFLQAEKIEFGLEEEMLELTGCKFGTLPPIGEIFGLNTIVDPSSLEQPQLCFNAGELTKSVFLSNHEYKKLVENNLFKITKEIS